MVMFYTKTISFSKLNANKMMLESVIAEVKGSAMRLFRIRVLALQEQAGML